MNIFCRIGLHSKIAFIDDSNNVNTITQFIIDNMPNDLRRSVECYLRNEFTTVTLYNFIGLALDNIRYDAVMLQWLDDKILYGVKCDNCGKVLVSVDEARLRLKERMPSFEHDILKYMKSGAFTKLRLKHRMLSIFKKNFFNVVDTYKISKKVG